NSDLYNGATISRMLRHFGAMLEDISEDTERRIGEISMLTTEEHDQLVFEWNNNNRHHRQDCLDLLLNEQVEQRPEAIAACCVEEHISYQMLNQSAAQLSGCLSRKGVGPEVVVGLCAERSVRLLVGALATLKAGGAYLPLDPAYPKERIAYMLSDSQARVLLIQEKFTR